MVIEVKDAAVTEPQSKKEEIVKQQLAAVNELQVSGIEKVESNVQKIAQETSVETAPAVAEVQVAATVDEKPENHELDKQTIASNEVVEDAVGEAKKDFPEMAKEADREMPAAGIKARKSTRFFMLQCFIATPMSSSNAGAIPFRR